VVALNGAIASMMPIADYLVLLKNLVRKGSEPRSIAVVAALHFRDIAR